MAYERLLERLHLVDEDWIIKGATALLARDIGGVHTSWASRATPPGVDRSAGP
jgi:hypothetical protein